ncbi:hypothetical protein AGABI2DRAFT_143427 [Agaricus bisporus var. bisporus H97]|nr:hypothetical protein AGABI2DRAFT_143427 [Agaricus bisporus var. bisporus H97]EKV46258.1 hypothetical protein AGABI2DRAFT_143427 [Agaricus bisporus var. bisporus H97]
MSRYPSCLHPPLFSSQISSYSSLAGALKTESPRTLDFNNPRRRRIPQYKGGASCGHATLSPPILFDHFGALGQGVRVQHFIILSTNALLKEIGGAEDQILTGLKANHILLKMNWQGYECLNWVRSVPVSQSICRAQLGARIVMVFWEYLQDVQDSRLPNPGWMKEFGMVNFDQVVLIGLYNIYDNVWQADLALDIPLESSSP